MYSNVRTSMAVLAAITLALVTTSTTSLPQASAKAKIQCKPSVGFAQVDPVVSRGAVKSAHLHEYFANKTMLTLDAPQNATYSQLAGKTTQCENAGDTAAYWTPALLRNGTKLPAARFIAYYRSFDHQDVGQAQAYPADMRMVTGTEPDGLRHYNWTCGQNSSMSNPVFVIPDCSKSSGTTYLTVHYDFPSCWDGKLNQHTGDGNTADFAPSGVTNHLAFYRKGRPSSCPSGFPIKLPELRETISWGDGSPSYWNKSELRLSSDEAGQPAGSSSHADFWNTWVQAELVDMVAQCVNKAPASGAKCD
ncbi:MAG: DUF1996 domain-containing protein [Nocardioidaceae bacterium]